MIKNKSETNIKIGTTILTEEPFVYVLKSKLRTEACDCCLERGKVLKCSGCQYVYYCNRVCQKEAWNVHKTECANLKRIAPRVLPDAARLMARIVVKLSKGGDHEKSYYTENSFRKFKDLMSRKIFLLYPFRSNIDQIVKNTNAMRELLTNCALRKYLIEEIKKYKTLK